MSATLQVKQYCDVLWGVRQHKAISSRVMKHSFVKHEGKRWKCAESVLAVILLLVITHWVWRNFNFNKKQKSGGVDLFIKHDKRAFQSWHHEGDSPPGPHPSNRRPICPEASPVQQSVIYHLSGMGNLAKIELWTKEATTKNLYGRGVNVSTQYAQYIYYQHFKILYKNNNSLKACEYQTWPGSSTSGWRHRPAPPWRPSSPCLSVFEGLFPYSFDNSALSQQINWTPGLPD